MKKLLLFPLLIFAQLAFSQNWPVFANTSYDILCMKKNFSGNLLYCGGSFTQVDNLNVNRVAAFDGINWLNLGTGIGTINGEAVWDFENFTGVLFAAGSFSHLGNNTPADNIAFWNGSTWNPIPGTNGGIMDLQVFNGNLYAAGYFDTAGTVPAKGIACWNGNSWSSVGNFTEYATAAGIYNNELYAGSVSGKIWKWNGTSWVYLSQAGLSNNSCNFSPLIKKIYPFQNNLYVGGNFDHFNSQNQSSLVQFDFANWTGPFTAAPFYCIRTDDMISDTNHLFITGDYDTLDNSPAHNYAVFNGSQWISSAGGPAEGYAIEIFQGYLFISSRNWLYRQPLNNILAVNNENENDSFDLFPNPAETEIHLRFSKNTDAEIFVCSYDGEKVLENHLSGKEADISLSGFADGIYLIRLTDKNGNVSSRKFIKTR